MRFGSIAKVLAECKLKYYRISECIVAQAVFRPVCAREIEQPWNGCRQQEPAGNNHLKACTFGHQVRNVEAAFIVQAIPGQ